MTLTSDYSITRLFVDKTVTIFIKDETTKQIKIKLKTIRDFYTEPKWNIFYSLITKNDYTQIFQLNNPNSSLEFIQKILFLGQYPQYREVYNICISTISELFENVEIKGTDIIINGISITEEIWEYIIYLLKLSYGEKVVQPPTFESEEARKLYMAQIANEERIRKIRAQKSGDSDTLMKILLSITYKFPSLTIDYLFNQTMAQIQWLQKYAAGAVSYEVNAQAFAAGNVKKGKKLDFFIK